MKSVNLFMIILLSFTLGTVFACSHNGNQNENKEPPVFEGLLEGVVVKPSTVSLYYEAVGTIRARTKAALSSKIAGQIKEITVEEGSRVQAGDLLLLIDDREVIEKLKQA